MSLSLSPPAQRNRTNDDRTRPEKTWRYPVGHRRPKNRLLPEHIDKVIATYTVPQGSYRETQRIPQGTWITPIALVLASVYGYVHYKVGTTIARLAVIWLVPTPLAVDTHGHLSHHNAA